MNDSTVTVELLRRWHSGDREALDALFERDLPWIQQTVHRRLGPLLRARAETQDLVQEVAIEFLRYGPRFLLSSRRQFRALLARIAENVIRGQLDWLTAQRRSIHRERPLPGDTVLDLDGSMKTVREPGEQAERNEWDALVRLGIELVDAADRQILLLREWEDTPFAEIGRHLDISEDAARMRFHRAMARLAEKIVELRGGGIEAALGNSGEEDDLES